MLKIAVSAMSGGQAVLFLISVLATFGVFLTLVFVPDRIGQLLFTSVTVIALWFAARSATSTEAHRMRTARYGVFVFGGILASVVVANYQIDSVARWMLQWGWPESAILSSDRPTVLPVAMVLLAAVVMFGLLMWALRSPPPLGAIPKDPHIQEASYLVRRAGFVSVLKSRLETVDEELRWHHEDFVNLRAEVDVRNAGASRRRVADLVEAIKLNRDADVFVVVGVPGAGKSVALRKACMDLLNTQRSNERIPIYVNLKEWLAHRRWTPETPPSDSEFSAFVQSNIRSRLPDRALSFFDEHFNRLVDAGEIFFLFDSFDEVPGLLDADETSKLLDAVSVVIVRYLRAQASGRGVIASRYYRRPRLGQEKHVQLDVRPFSERQIAQVISQRSGRADTLQTLLFKSRPDLGALARNPFNLSLILLHSEGGGQPPRNQSELFASYINRSLSDAKEQLEILELDQASLLQAMGDISWAMFESDQRGLEMTVRELSQTLERTDINDIVDALVSARLMRKAPRTQAVSFVHRRFNEYFLVARWRSGKRKVPFEAIPTDTRFRDALVLYAEVAGDLEAQQLAQYCWREVDSFKLGSVADVTSTMRSIYSLRFLTEAFRIRQTPIATFQRELGSRIHSIVTQTDDIVVRKIAVEGVGLLSPADAKDVLFKAISAQNRWIIDAAFSACRYLGSVPQSLQRQLFRVMGAREQLWILIPDRDFLFTVRLADAFVSLRRQINAFRLDMWISLVGGLFSMMFVIWLNVDVFRHALVILIGVNAVLLLSYLFVWEPVQKLRRIRRDARNMQFLALRRVIVENMIGVLRPDIARFRIASTHLGFAEIFIGMVRAFPLAALYAAGQAKDVGSKWPFAAIALGLIPFFSSAFWLRTRARTQTKFLLQNTKRWLSKGAARCIGDIWRILPYALGFIGTIFVALGFGVVVAWAIKLHWIIEWALIGVFGIAVTAVLLSLGVINALNPWRRDRKRLKVLIKHFDHSRELIAKTFNSFETESARLRYVMWIQHKAETPEHLRALSDVTTNPWPYGRRPNIHESEASILLAQLDARWLKLDI